MATAVSRTLYLDTLSAQREVEVLTARINRLDKKIQEGQASGRKMTKELSDMEKAKAALTNVQNQIDRGLKPSLKQLEDFARRTNAELRRLSQSDPQFNVKLKQYQDAQGEIRKIKDQIGGVQKAQDGWANSVKSFGKGFIGGIVASLSIQAISDFFRGATEEAKNAELAGMKFEARLRNIGRLDVLPRLTEEAERLAEQFRFLDNDDIIAVFDKLITYGKLTEQQIKQLTPVIIDFAAQQQISLEESASVIIKALEGNGKALKEYGIDIKDAKNETEAFGIIMDQLKPKVEGAAQVFSESLAGNIATTQQEIANLKEEIGTSFLPAIKSFYQSIADFTSGIRETFNSDVGFFTKWFALMGSTSAKAKVFVSNQMKEMNEELLKNVDKFAFTGFFPQPQNENTVLGGGNKPNKTETPKTSTIKENPRIKLLQDLKKLEEEVALLGKNSTAQEIQRVTTKYQTLINQAKNYADIVIRLEAARDKELEFIIKKATERYEEELKKQEEAERQKTKVLLDEAIKRREAELTAARERGQLALQIDNRNLLAQARMRLLTAPGPRARLEAEKMLLEVQMEQELQNVNLTEQEKEVIREQYRQRAGELDFEYFARQVQMIIEYAQIALDAISNFQQARAQRENAALQRELKQNDTRRQSYKRLLDQRLITEQEYQLRLNKLQEEEDKKRAELNKKQFRRQKETQIAQAIMNAAAAAIRLWVDPGWPMALPLSVLLAAQVASQISAINSQQPPQFEKGGFLRTGKRHREGGMPVLDPTTGQKVAEVEQGEAILSRSTVRNNPELVGALLQSSMYQGGRRIRVWDQSYKPVNYSGITKAIQRRYETGGIVNTGSSTDMSGLMQTVQQSIEQNQAVNLSLMQTINELRAQLQEGISATISQKKLDDATALKNRIIRDATFRP